VTELIVEFGQHVKPEPVQTIMSSISMSTLNVTIKHFFEIGSLRESEPKLSPLLSH